jgi:outer membrane protein assembly factor BamB
MAIIELGDLSEHTTAPDDAPASRFDRRLRARAGAAALAVLCALGLTGSGRPAPPRVHELWSTQLGDGEYPLVTGDVALVSRETPAGSELTAYDLVTGTVRWATGTGRNANWTIPDEKSGLLYVAKNARTYATPDWTAWYATETEVLDRGTGQIRWRRSGQMLAGTATDALFGDFDDHARITALHLVRAVDGAPVWDRAIDPAQSLVIPDDLPATGQIVTGTAAGVLTSLRYSDGVPLATRRIGPRPEPDWMSQLHGGRYYDIQEGDIQEGARTTVTVYRADTMTELWRITRGGEDILVRDCGPVLCLGAAEQMYGLDPDTGRQRWQLSRVDPTSIGRGRLLAVTPEADSEILLDAATGRSLSAEIPGNVLTGTRDDGSMIVLRGDGYPDLHTAVRRLDPVTGRTIMIGSLPGTTTSCETHGRYLSCLGQGNRLSIIDVG